MGYPVAYLLNWLALMGLAPDKRKHINKKNKMQ
jgi:hypothetical protein